MSSNGSNGTNGSNGANGHGATSGIHAIAPESLPDEHVLSVAATTGIDLPAAALEALRTVGVPRLLRVIGWAGPALFQSELAEGALVSTATAGALVERTGEHEGYVLGSVRLGPKTPPYSVFVLLRSSGEVWLLDTSNAEMDRYVNASLDAFLASMLAFHGAFDHLMVSSEDREKHVASFREVLGRIDARALADDHNYWPGWIEEMA